MSAAARIDTSARRRHRKAGVLRTAEPSCRALGASAKTTLRAQVAPRAWAANSDLLAMTRLARAC